MSAWMGWVRSRRAKRGADVCLITGWFRESDLLYNLPLSKEEEERIKGD